MYDVGGGGNELFAVAPNFIGIIFILVFAIIIINVCRDAKQWKENENSPHLSVPAIIKSKRTKVTRHNHHHDHILKSHINDLFHYIRVRKRGSIRIPCIR